jgi:hypothetical protein
MHGVSRFGALQIRTEPSRVRGQPTAYIKKACPSTQLVSHPIQTSKEREKPIDTTWGGLGISDRILIDVYLRSKIAGKDVGGNCIHDADVNSNHPYDLVHKHASGKGVCWFFSPVRYVHSVGNSKASKKGSWHSEGKKKMVKGSTGGYLERLTYHEAWCRPGRSSSRYG